MSDWRDVMSARTEADDMAKAALADPRLMQSEALLHALAAVRLEIRALGVTIDYAAPRQ